MISQQPFKLHLLVVLLFFAIICEQPLYAAEGTLKWVKTSGSTSSPAIGLDGTVYAAKNGFKEITAYYPDGTTKWVYQPDKEYVFSAPAVGLDGIVYVSGTEPYVGYPPANVEHAFVALSKYGNLKWKYTIQDSAQLKPTCPALGADSTLYFGSPSNVYALNSNGTTKWTFKTGIGQNHYSSAVSVSMDGSIYAVAENGSLYALNQDGTLKWEYIIGETYPVPVEPAIDPEGNVYAVGSKNLYAFDSSGNLSWRYTAGGNALYGSPVIANDGTIYFGSSTWFSDGANDIYAINQDGTLKWKFTVSGTINSSPAIGADGIVYVLSAHYLYALNPDGTKRWSHYFSGVHLSSPAIGTGGVLYVGDEGVCAFEIISQGLAESCWPMFHHDARHTGYLPGPPVAAFEAHPLKGFAPLVVSFTDMSIGVNTEWLWNFGDGSSGIVQDPTHTYNSCGSYSVSLSASGEGGSDSTVLDNYVKVACRCADSNRDGRIGIEDAILSLQLLVGINPVSVASLDDDIGNNNKIGIEEVVYILQWLSDSI